MALDTSLSSLTPDTRAAVEDLLAALAARGVQYQVRSTRRSCQEQNEFYAIGRGEGDTRAIVTQARGCLSWHVLGRAVDITLLGGASYELLGQLAEERGFVWGGRFPGFPDVGHVEWHPGVKIEAVCPNPSDCEGGLAQSQALFPDPAPSWQPLAALALGAFAGYLGARAISGDIRFS